MTDPEEPRLLVVDGETWSVTEEDGQYRYAWLSGIAESYGFTTGRTSGPAWRPTLAHMEEMIREFMSNINPETGYLD